MAWTSVDLLLLSKTDIKTMDRQFGQLPYSYSLEVCELFYQNYKGVLIKHLTQAKLK